MSYISTPSIENYYYYSFIIREMNMIGGIVIFTLVMITQQFVLTLVQDETCFSFYPNYDEKHHEIYFLTAHDIQFHAQAKLTVYSPTNQILNSSDLYPHSHYFYILTKTTQQHRICIQRYHPHQTIVHFDIIDQYHFQQHSKAGKEDIMKLARSAGMLNLNLAKFDLVQKSIFQKSRLESLEITAETQHLYMLTFLKLLVILGVTGVQYYLVRKMYAK